MGNLALQAASAGGHEAIVNCCRRVQMSCTGRIWPALQEASARGHEAILVLMTPLELPAVHAIFSSLCIDLCTHYQAASFTITSNLQLMCMQALP